MSKTKFILSIDGGGIRGIIPAMVLACIESKCNKPISSIFSLMAGTSTGAITVAALSKCCEGKPHYTAVDVVNLYETGMPVVFAPSIGRHILAWFYGHKYPQKPLSKVLDITFGEEVLKNTLSNVLIPSYDIRNSQPFFFKTWDDESNIFKLQDVLKAAIATPTFFSPAVFGKKKCTKVLINGSVFANNPAVCAYVDALKCFPESKLVLLSLGTGNTEKPIKFYNVGKLFWYPKMRKITFSSGLDHIDYQLQQIMGTNYLRIQQTALRIASPAIDDTSPKNMANLKKEACHVLECNKSTIERFCQIVTEASGPEDASVPQDD